MGHWKHAQILFLKMLINLVGSGQQLKPYCMFECVYVEVAEELGGGCIL